MSRTPVTGTGGVPVGWVAAGGAVRVDALAGRVVAGELTTAVVVNLIAVEADGPGEVTATRPGAPGGRMVHVHTGINDETVLDETAASLITVPIGADGRVEVRSSVGTDASLITVPVGTDGRGRTRRRSLRMSPSTST